MIWKLIAWIVTRPVVTGWLIARAKRTPYSNITGANGVDVYMERYWLFNPYALTLPDGSIHRQNWFMRLLPSARIHKINRPDTDRHLHSHPWNARTIILRGWYQEERPAGYGLPPGLLSWVKADDGTWRDVFLRKQGYTGRILHTQYHRISRVPDDGVWTLFITWKYRHSWGFWVDGEHVYYKDYLK